MDETAIEGVEVMRGRVREEWIDVNRHMNVAYYVLAFDLAIDEVWTRFGITDSYVRDGGLSTFAVESHVMWLKELLPDSPYLVTTQILAFDDKRIHQFLRMYHAAEGFLAATSEWMNLHVDLATRRVAPWPNTILDGLSRFAAEQGDWAWPESAGHRMQVKKPLFEARRASG